MHLRALAFSCAALCLLGPLVHADEPLVYGMDAKEVVPKTSYEFRLVSFDSEISMAVFHFKWKGAQPVEFSTYSPQDGSSFEAQVAEYCFLTKDKWTHLGIGYCGTGREPQMVKPNRDYVIKVGLPFLPSEKAPEWIPQTADKMVISLPVNLEKGSGFVMSDEIALPLKK